MRKNVASQVISAQLISKTDGSDVTTGTTTVYVTGDGGSQGSGGGTVTHEGNGTWSYVPTQAETNYTHISFTFVNTNAVSAVVNVYTVGQDFTAAQLAATVPSGVTLADDAITAAKFDESTAFPLKSADTGATAVARTGADGDTLETLSDEIAVVDANVDTIQGQTTSTGVVLTSAYDAAKTAAQEGDAMELTPTAISDIRGEFLLTDDSLSAPATTADSVELTSAYAADGALVGCHLLHFTNSGDLIQARVITAWNNTTMVATVDRPWDVVPQNTDRVRVYAGPLTAQSGTILSASALSAIETLIEEALSVTTRAELAAVPAANAPFADKMNWVFMLLRNRRVVTATEETVYADDAATALATSDVTAASGTLTRGEYTDVP